ncbi:MAG: cobalt transporter CbiM, partial [Desulfobacterales bacterium]
MSSFRRKPVSSKSKYFWMPDQVRHDGSGTFYEFIKVNYKKIKRPGRLKRIEVRQAFPAFLFTGEKMHISEGVLSAPVLVTGAALAVAGISVGLKKMDYEKIPEAAVLSAAFFVASLIHVPMGPSNVHLVLNGINGLLLGWLCFPSILVALALQAILFQFGGITVLGVNTVIMALPGLMGYYLFGGLIKGKNRRLSLAAAFAG